MTSSANQANSNENLGVSGQYVPTSPITSFETKCPFFKLLKRIWEFVKDVFVSLGDLFKPSPNLSETRIKEMRDKIAMLQIARGAAQKNKLVSPKSSQEAKSSVIDRLDLDMKLTASGVGVGDCADPNLRRSFFVDSLLDSNFSPESSLRLNAKLSIEETPGSIQDESMRNLHFETQIIASKAAQTI